MAALSPQVTFAEMTLVAPPCDGAWERLIEVPPVISNLAIFDNQTPSGGPVVIKDASGRLMATLKLGETQNWTCIMHAPPTT